MQVFEVKGDSMNVGRSGTSCPPEIQLGEFAGPPPPQRTSSRSSRRSPPAGRSTPRPWSVKAGRTTPSPPSPRSSHRSGVPGSLCPAGEPPPSGGSARRRPPPSRAGGECSGCRSQPDQPDHLRRRLREGDSAPRQELALRDRGDHGCQAVRGHPETQQELDFWHGWVLYQTGYSGPGGPDPSRAPSGRLRCSVRPSSSSSPLRTTPAAGINLQQILEASDTYIEIQEAIIQRGR